MLTKSTDDASVTHRVSWSSCENPSGTGPSRRAAMTLATCVPCVMPGSVRSLVLPIRLESNSQCPAAGAGRQATDRRPTAAAFRCRPLRLRSRPQAATGQAPRARAVTALRRSSAPRCGRRCGPERRDGWTGTPIPPKRPMTVRGPHFLVHPVSEFLTLLGPEILIYKLDPFDGGRSPHRQRNFTDYSMLTHELFLLGIPDYIPSSACEPLWSVGFAPVSVDTFRLFTGGVLMSKTHPQYVPECRRQIVELIRAERAAPAGELVHLVSIAALS